MATTNTTHVNFVKVPTMAKFTDITPKVDGTIYFIVDAKKIYLDGVMYGFNDSDIPDIFLKLTGGEMTGPINMGGNQIHNISELRGSSGGPEIAFYTDTSKISLGNILDVSHESPGEGESGVGLLSKINFSGANIVTGIPAPHDETSPISAGYLNQEVLSQKGVAYGFAPLDEDKKVPSNHLPSYVDDIIEVNNFESLPATGEKGKLYVTVNNNHLYRWGGSAWVNVSDGNAHLVLGTTSSTAYRGDYGNTAYTHSQLESGNPHKVTASDVGLGSVVNQGLATDAEAVAGNVNNKYMTPKRTKLAIETLAPKLSWTVVA